MLLSIDCMLAYEYERASRVVCLNESHVSGVLDVCRLPFDQLGTLIYHVAIVEWASSFFYVYVSLSTWRALIDVFRLSAYVYAPR